VVGSRVVARWLGAWGTRRRRRGSLQGEHWLVVLAGSLDSHDRAAVGTVETDRANAYDVLLSISFSPRAEACLRARDASQFRHKQELPGVSPQTSLFGFAEQVTQLTPSRSSRHACLSSQRHLSRHLSMMLRCPLGMLSRSRRVWPTASLLTWRSIADSTTWDDECYS